MIINGKQINIYIHCAAGSGIVVTTIKNIHVDFCERKFYNNLTKNICTEVEIMSVMDPNVRKQWHDGFYGAIELEFEDDSEFLEFKPEYLIGKKPLIMDELIIVKKKGIRLHNKIGHIFKNLNILEYKGPEGALGIDEFSKGISYALLFKANAPSANGIRFEELSLTFIREAFPRKLFKELKHYKFSIEKYANGIYYISRCNAEMLFPIQIVVGRQLEEEEHLSLKMFSMNVSYTQAQNFLNRQKMRPWSADNADALLQVSVAANRELFEKIKGDAGMCEALRDLMKDEINEEINEAVNKAVNKAVNVALNEAEKEKAKALNEAEKEKAKAVDVATDNILTGVIRRMREAGKSMEDIMISTGLSSSEIEKMITAMA